MINAGMTASERHAVILMLGAGVPVLTAPPQQRSSDTGIEYRYNSWREAAVRHDVLDRWHPGWMLAAVTGVAFDVIDIDPRNGGRSTFEALREAVPQIAGVAATPGGGEHLYVAPTGDGLISFGGIDYKGIGGLIYIPGCSRPKYGGAGYIWVTPIDWTLLSGGNTVFTTAMRDAHPNRPYRGSQTRALPVAGNVGPRGTAYGRAALRREADQVARTSFDRNTRLNTAAFRCAQLAAAGHLRPDAIVDALADAADECGLVRDDGIAACVATINSGIRAGLANGRNAAEPDA